MEMKNVEPTLETIEDYSGKESKEKRMTIWIVILSGLLVGAVYGIIKVNSSVSDDLGVSHTTGIYKH
ncbi:MAG: hypothetical protein E3J96_06220 [Sulfurovum sp.]|nr:MAG: hypothetical protein E3J96_06220 [Sulfurovum sp.]